MDPDTLDRLLSQEVENRRTEFQEELDRLGTGLKAIISVSEVDYRNCTAVLTAVAVEPIKNLMLEIKCGDEVIAEIVEGEVKHD